MFPTLAVDVKAAPLPAHDAARRMDAGEPCTTKAAMAKLKMVGRVTDRALEVFGGIGYLKAHPIDGIYRDPRAVRSRTGRRRSRSC